MTNLVFEKPEGVQAVAGAPAAHNPRAATQQLEMAWLTDDSIGSGHRWLQRGKQEAKLSETEGESSVKVPWVEKPESSGPRVTYDSPIGDNEIEMEQDELDNDDDARPYYGGGQLTRDQEELLMGVVLKTVATPIDQSGELYNRLCQAFNVRVMQQVICRLDGTRPRRSANAICNSVAGQSCLFAPHCSDLTSNSPCPVLQLEDMEETESAGHDLTVEFEVKFSDGDDEQEDVAEPSHSRWEAACVYSPAASDSGSSGSSPPLRAALRTLEALLDRGHLARPAKPAQPGEPSGALAALAARAARRAASALAGDAGRGGGGGAALE